MYSCVLRVAFKMRSDTDVRYRLWPALDKLKHDA
jgi:hypothetical protein